MSRPENKNMTKDDLIQASMDHLRLSIACTLNIEVIEYRSSLHTRTVVNNRLNNVMSLGFNKDFVEALNEAAGYHWLGRSPSSKEFDEFVEELRDYRITFRKEIEAYSFLFEAYNAGKVPQDILEEIKIRTPLKEEYKNI